MDLNKVMLIGRLTRDPEVKTIPSGQTVANFSVATGRKWKDQQSGEQKEQTEFHNVVVWRRLAEICGQYLKKGSQVYLEGHLQTRSWDDPAGNKRYRTEVVVDNMIMLGGKSAGAGNAVSNNAVSANTADSQTPPSPQPSADEETISVEDIPF
ncbi:MAG: hypothetical protein A2319_00925 [Candidatus Kerfeldbacteria bacterium RIFOXYB2_FULL_38_14]|uniref:Single-stranded DNA-binding protein n=1 Tax=Candidatus Kerfeldbacteria bacterium RIFOXYB2_FULL_38_14 TaxID=1798547 RepID=A0A1G2BDH2_9BACT|nr:MAG: hypothetical protein A2319_00925 [Candidatus Kerfeldbacteria bacterium RIFOXYB2_FULL_38_14]